MALPPGTLLLERYRIERVLGQGGFGAVYLATDEEPGHPLRRQGEPQAPPRRPSASSGARPPCWPPCAIPTCRASPTTSLSWPRRAIPGDGLHRRRRSQAAAGGRRAARCRWPRPCADRVTLVRRTGLPALTQPARHPPRHQAGQHQDHPGRGPAVLVDFGIAKLAESGPEDDHRGQGRADRRGYVPARAVSVWATPTGARMSTR